MLLERAERVHDGWDSPRKDPEEDVQWHKVDYYNNHDSPSYLTSSHSSPETNTCNRVFEKALLVLIYLQASKWNKLWFCNFSSLETVCWLPLINSESLVLASLLSPLFPLPYPLCFVTKAHVVQAGLELLVLPTLLPVLSLQVCSTMPDHFPALKVVGRQSFSTQCLWMHNTSYCPYLPGKGSLYKTVFILFVGLL